MLWFQLIDMGKKFLSGRIGIAGKNIILCLPGATKCLSKAWKDSAVITPVLPAEFRADPGKF